jgi:hypothetical protein
MSQSGAPDMAKHLDFTISMTLDSVSIAKMVWIGGTPIQISCNFLL